MAKGPQLAGNTKPTAPPNKGGVGAIVKFCGHEGVFRADLIRVGNVVVVRSNGPLDRNLLFDAMSVAAATHHLMDFPSPGYWNPRVGVFVVPHRQLVVLKKDWQQLNGD